MTQIQMAGQEKWPCTKARWRENEDAAGCWAKN